MVRSEFGVHLLNDVGIKRAQEMAERFSALLDWLENEGGCTNPSREFSLAKTQLEIASFLAKKAMAINPENNQKK